MKTILKHFSQSIIVMILATFFTFSLMFLTPSDPAEMFYHSKGIIPTNEALAQTRQEMCWILEKFASVSYKVQNIFKQKEVNL